MIEFLTETVEHRTGHVVVAGLVNAGVVRLGSVFTQATLPQADNAGCEVRLTVSKIVAYRHELDELPTGMTGELHLQGTGADRLLDRTTMKGMS
jgi:hypothetical protein